MLKSHPKDLTNADHPFLVGVEYYRPPLPPRECWDADFAAIRAAGMCIIRTFPCWNWVQPAEDRFVFDDLDLFFELAHRHDLWVWIDMPVATHGACPDWLLKRYPDMAVVQHDGTVGQPSAANFAPQGVMIHNVDHPAWREYAGRYVSTLVNRYKNHPRLLIWGTWDGFNLTNAWIKGGELPAYNDYTIRRYRDWLRDRYTLEALNERLLRRYQRWEDVEPPRSNEALVEMTLYRQFHYENMAEHLGWLADHIDRLDGQHEQRSHGTWHPRPFDAPAAARVDSWGLSHSSAGMLSGEETYGIAAVCCGYQWSNALGRGGRWWNEEIHAGFKGGLHGRTAQATPQESTLFLWLSLIYGAAGALYWQYRPEYLSFEGPGLNLAALDGQPTARLDAIRATIKQIERIKHLLPLSMPQPQVALVYSPLSHDLYNFAEPYVRQNRVCYGDFIRQFSCVYSTLWHDSVACDVLPAPANWSDDYRAIYLPSMIAPDAATIAQIRQSLTCAAGPRVIADGFFAAFSAKGHWSFRPPHGLHDLIDIGIEDFDVLTEADIRAGRNVMTGADGEFAITAPCTYAILRPGPLAEGFAMLKGKTVATRACGGRFTWLGVPLASAFDEQTRRRWLAPLLHNCGVQPAVTVSGDPVVCLPRRSPRGEPLLFVVNPHDQPATSTLAFADVTALTDAISGQRVGVAECTIELRIAGGEVRVFLCQDAPPRLNKRELASTGTIP